MYDVSNVGKRMRRVECEMICVDGYDLALMKTLWMR